MQEVKFFKTKPVLWLKQNNLLELYQCLIQSSSEEVRPKGHMMWEILGLLPQGRCVKKFTFFSVVIFQKNISNSLHVESGHLCSLYWDTEKQGVAAEWFSNQNKIIVMFICRKGSPSLIFGLFCKWTLLERALFVLVTPPLAFPQLPPENIALGGLPGAWYQIFASLTDSPRPSVTPPTTSASFVKLGKWMWLLMYSCEACLLRVLG